MDYEGKYFPDEDDGRQSKTGKTVKKIFKYLIYGISFLVYAILIYRIIATSDLDLVEQMIFTSETRAEAERLGDDFDLYYVFPETFMNNDATIQIKNCYYAAAQGEYELGTRYSSEITGDNMETELLYTLTDSRDNEYPLVNRVRDTKDKYVFERLCFSNVAFDLSENVTNRGEDFSQEYSRLYEEGLALAVSDADAEDFAEDYADSATEGTVYTLRIYRPGTEAPIFSTEVYSNNFYISEEKYDSPDSKYLKGAAAQ